MNVHLDLLKNTVGQEHAELTQTLPPPINRRSTVSKTTRLQKKKACKTLRLRLRDLASSNKVGEPIGEHSGPRHRHTLARTPEMNPPTVPKRPQIPRLKLLN
jgi:hypothetical protein